jgi:hypothetical protein
VQSPIRVTAITPSTLRSSGKASETTPTGAGGDRLGLDRLLQLHLVGEQLRQARPHRQPVLGREAGVAQVRLDDHRLGGARRHPRQVPGDGALAHLLAIMELSLKQFPDALEFLDYVVQ